MDNKQSLDVLEQALNVANKAGAFTLRDAAVINSAFESLKANLLQKPEPTPAETAKKATVKTLKND